MEGQIFSISSYLLPFFLPQHSKFPFSPTPGAGDGERVTDKPCRSSDTRRGRTWGGAGQGKG